MSRIFLSHSSRDNRQAVALKRWLADQRPELANEIFLDIDPQTGLRLGEQWKGQLFSSNSRCESVICLLSKDWEASHECKAEYRTAEGLGKRILVARLEDLGDTDITGQWQRCDLFAEGPQTEIEVADGPPVRFNSAALRQLRRAIEGSGIGPENFVWPPSEHTRRAPYRGWVPFEDVDAGVFFGRDAAIAQGLDELRRMRFRLLATLSGLKSLFVVLGPSGSGKSSFLRAGLIPRLQRDDRRFVVLGIMRPERAALTGEQGLAAAIDSGCRAVGLAGTPLGEIKKACLEDSDRVYDLLSQLRVAAAERLTDTDRDNGAVAEPPTITSQEGAAPTLVLPLDQAEELFSADAGEQAERFLTLLAELVKRINATGVGLIVAATIRTDRYEAMQNHPALDGIGTLLFDELKPMPPNQFTQVITGPAARATEGGERLSITADLVKRLIDDATGGADTLPLLALTLARLYTDYASSGQLTLANYESMGGMGDVVNNEIEQILIRDPHDRATALEMLRSAFIPWLATINPDSDQPMRRVARYTDLPEASCDLIDALVAKRLLVRGERDGDAVVEVALESLLRQWDELDGWLREERQHLKTADDIERSAAAWQTQDHDPAWLLRGNRLIDAESLVNRRGFRRRLTAARDYLAACRRAEDEELAAEEQHRQAELQAARARQEAAEAIASAESEARKKAQQHSRRLRAVLAITAVIAIVAVTGLLGFIRANDQANKMLREATAQKLIAEARDLLAKGVDKQALQQLLIGQRLITASDDMLFYAIAVRAAGTRKIMENPPRPAGEGVIPVQSVAVSPVGNRIASGSNDHTVRVWDANTGSRLHELNIGGTGPAWSVAFSPDGTRIATGNSDGILQVWDADSGTKIGNPMVGQGPVNSVAFSRDGRLIAAGSGDGAVRVRDAATGADVVNVAAGDAGTSIRSVAFSPSGDFVVSAGDDSTVRLWDAHRGQPAAEPAVGDAPVMSVGFSPDGDRVVVGGLDGTIKILNGKTLEPVGTSFPAHPNIINSVAFSPDGVRIVSGGADNAVKVWDASSHKPIGDPLGGHHGAVSSVAFNQDGTRIVSGSVDGSVREWDAVAGLPIPAGNGQEIRAVAFSPDGRQMASAGTDGTVKLWDAATAAPIGRLGQPSQGHEHAINALAFNPRDGSQVVTGSTDGDVRLWDVRNPQQFKTLAKVNPVGSRLAGKPRIQSVAFSPDGSRIVSGGFDSAVRMWDTRTLNPIGAVSAHKVDDQGQPVPYQVWSVAFSPDGGQVVSGSGFDIAGGQNYLIQLWNVEPTIGANGPPIKGPPGWNVYSVGFSPDGQRIVSGSFDGTARLWNVSTREEAAPPMSGDQNPVLSVAFAHNHQWIVTGGAGGTARLWDTVNAPPVGMPLEGHQNWVHSVAFSPDDKWILSGSADGNLHLWPAPQHLADALCGKLTTNMSVKQWSEWVPERIDYEKVCPDLPVAPD